MTDILAELGVPFQQNRPGWYSVDCPWCGKPGKPGLGIPTGQRRICSCWKCGVHSLADALTEITGQPWQLIKEMLGHAEETAVPTQKAAGRLVLPGAVEALARCHKTYLQHRGFHPETLVTLWGVQGIGLAAKLSWRVFIPVRSQGKTVSWTTRAIGSAKPKYVNARPEEEAVPAKSLLFGQEYVRHATIVCEGPFDAMRVGPGAVCTFGVNVTRAQLARIAAIPVRIVCFDNEPVAQERARRLCDDLAPYPGKTVRVEIDAADPGSASTKEVARLRRMLE